MRIFLYSFRIFVAYLALELANKILILDLKPFFCTTNYKNKTALFIIQIHVLLLLKSFCICPEIEQIYQLTIETKKKCYARLLETLKAFYSNYIRYTMNSLCDTFLAKIKNSIQILSNRLIKHNGR